MSRYNFLYFLRNGIPRHVTEEQRRKDAEKSAKEAVDFVREQRRRKKKQEIDRVAALPER